MKKFEKRLRFDRVTALSLVSSFLGHSVLLYRSKWLFDTTGMLNII